MEGDTKRVYEKLGLSPDDYMMLYWDFPNKHVMAIDHIGKHSTVGDIYDVVNEKGCVVSFGIKRCQDCVNTS